jgi:hypothetical protein
MCILGGQFTCQLGVGKALKCGAVGLGVQPGESCASSIPGGSHEAGDSLRGKRPDYRGSVPLLGGAFGKCGIQVYFTCVLRNASDGIGIKERIQTTSDVEEHIIHMTNDEEDQKGPKGLKRVSN